MQQRHFVLYQTPCSQLLNLSKFRPKSDIILRYNQTKNQTLFHNLTTLRLSSVPAGINVPYLYSG